MKKKLILPAIPPRGKLDEGFAAEFANIQLITKNLDKMLKHMRETIIAMPPIPDYWDGQNPCREIMLEKEYGVCEAPKAPLVKTRTDKHIEAF